MRVVNVDDLFQFDMFQHMTEEDLDLVKSMLFERTYKKNQQLFTEGDPRERIFLLKSGYVKLEKTNQEATMLYINYIKPKGIFPYVGLFTEDYYRYSAHALTDISLYYIPTKQFESLIRNDNEQLYLIIQYLNNQMKKHQDRIQTVSTPFATDRVEQAISFLVQNYSIVREDGYYIDIPVTMTEIAKIAATTRETVSQVFHQLMDQDVLSMQGRQIIVYNHRYFLNKTM